MNKHQPWSHTDSKTRKRTITAFLCSAIVSRYYYHRVTAALDVRGLKYEREKPPEFIKPVFWPKPVAQFKNTVT
jgi:hypothetical protein